MYVNQKIYYTILLSISNPISGTMSELPRRFNDVNNCPILQTRSGIDLKKRKNIKVYVICVKENKKGVERESEKKRKKKKREKREKEEEEIKKNTYKHTHIHSLTLFPSLSHTHTCCVSKSIRVTPCHNFFIFFEYLLTAYNLAR